MSVRELHGMNYSSIELTHPVTLTMPEVLFKLANWLEENDIHDGIITGLTTQSSLDDDDEFKTTFIYAY